MRERVGGLGLAVVCAGRQCERTASVLPVRGLPGSIIAPLGLVTPAVIIILLVSKILNTLWQNPKVKGLFYALRPASVGLIGAAAFSVCAVSLFSTEQGLVLHWPSILLFGMTAMNLPKLKELPSVFFIAVAAVVGIVFQMVD